MTGATSGTGRRLCARLLEQGHSVVCFTRSGKGLPSGVVVVIGALPEPGEPWGDNAARFSSALEGCALVHHFAHVRFAPAVVERARAAGVVRTVCISSARRFTQWPDASVRQVIAAENALEQHPEGWVALRTTMIYGSGLERNISKLTALVRKWPMIFLPGGGRHLIQPIFCDDLVEALLAAGHAPGISGEFIDVAGPEPFPFREAIREIARQLGLRRLVFPVPLGPAVLLARLLGRRHVARLRRLGEDRTLDIRSAQRLLEFSPRPFAEGLRLALQQSGIEH